ncbi:MAG TPA: CAP domain-containing protein [Chryseosolibacter sp.]|nr:CAP domain-containing protein [Chryseosolibacter sp.]
MRTPFILLIVAANFCVFAQTVPSTTGSKVDQLEAQEALNFHNKVRKDVGNIQLSWSAELAAYAQEWAENLASRNCAFEHRTGENKKKPFGENIFGGSGIDYTATDASKSWYSEIKEYVHGPLTYENWYPVGHYTQMVWYSTKEIGIGKATCENGMILIVANYNPPGNYIGQKAYE